MVFALAIGVLATAKVQDAGTDNRFRGTLSGPWWAELIEREYWKMQPANRRGECLAKPPQMHIEPC